MQPSRLLRRLVAVLCLLLLGTSTLPGLAGARPPARWDLSAGDRGSGPSLTLPHLAEATRSRDDVVWSDVPSKHWARDAIDYVGAANDWMLDSKPADDGTYAFKPEEVEGRGLFARAVVRAFAPDEDPDPSISFADLSADDKLYPFANVAVKEGWMATDGGQFRPDEPVTTTMVHRALVLALGLTQEATALDNLQTRDGSAFDTPEDFGTTLLGIRLGLRYNHGDESLDVEPSTPLPRAEVAWSLYRGATAPAYSISGLVPYAKIKLPNLSPKKRELVQFGIRYVGYPYVYAGEWAEETPAGYCCGYQPVGGFDCSGITWWVVKAAANGWDNVPPRDYRGWPLPERSSRDMAAEGDPIAFEEIKPGDLLFYDGDGDGTVDHVNVYIGNGWALDSSSSYGGVSILNVNSGWYHDHFVHARRIMGRPG